MEDEYQTTLKKKIQILFQLGKWLDVVKLCESYAEKYGKDMEIDTIRFKSERHLGAAALAVAKPVQEKEAGSKADPTGEPDVQDLDGVLLLPESLSEVEPVPAELEVSRTPADEMPFAREDKMAYDPDPVDSDLVITDPFADDEPGFSLAPDQPPVVMSEVFEAVEQETPPLEMESREEPAAGSISGEEEEVDFSKLGSMTMDADPQLTPEAPKPKPPAAAINERDTVFAGDADRSSWGDGDVFEPPAQESVSPDAQPEAVERSRPDEDHFRETAARTPGSRKKTFSPRLLLWIVLPLAAAAILWLALSGKLSSSGGKAPASDPAPAARPVTERKSPRARKVVPPAPVVDTTEADKAFEEKFLQASSFFNKGDTLKALALVLEAKKIKMTDPLRILEEQILARMQEDEARTKQESQAVQSQWQLESQAYAKAEAENTLSGWQVFLKAYPRGEFAAKAERKINAFQKQAQEDAAQQLLLRIQQAQKIKLRSAYLTMGQADITAMLRQSGKPPSQFEAHAHGGATVMLDFTTGLMWTLWNKPMDYSKARWWANRVTAGYGGWRLPSVEEALSLLQMDRAQYSGLPGFALWTGDTVNDQPRTAWVLKLPEGQFAAAGYEQSLYVWSVRKAGK